MTDSGTPSVEGVSLFDLVSGIVAGYLRDGRGEIERANSGVGQIQVRITVNLDGSAEPVTWSRGSVFFESNHDYKNRRH